MPELPEVEIQLNYLRGTALGRTIRKVSVFESRIIKNHSVSSFKRRLAGRRLVGASRRGKYLIVELDRGGILVLHFGMGGDLQYYRAPEPRPRFTRVELVLDNGYRLAFTCPRNICRVMSVKSASEVPGLRDMGPEPLCKAFTLSIFTKVIESGGSRRPIKALLMDQTRIAGIGNIYADQILFEAGIRPVRKGSSLATAEMSRVHRSIRRVLKKALGTASDEELPSHYIYSRDFRGEGCPTCGNPFVKTRVGGRTTRYCGVCQE